MDIITKSLARISKILKGFKIQLGLKANESDLRNLQAKIYQYQSKQETLTSVLDHLDTYNSLAWKHCQDEEYGYESPSYRYGY